MNRLFFLASLALTLVANSAQDPIKALLITGGCCHDYPRQKEIIPQGLQARIQIPIEWTVVLDASNGGKIPLHESKDWAKGYDVVVHNECHAGVRDKDWVENILKPHREGTPAVAIHCAMHSYRAGFDEWFKFLGVTSHRHGAHYPYEVHNLAKDNPIMKGFGETWGTPKGELYLISKLWDTATPLAQAFSRDTKKNEVCVWTNQYGKGRVFGTTMGHHNETMAAAPWLDMVSRGFLWSMDRLDDKLVKPGPAFDLGTVADVKKPAKKQASLPKGKGPENLALAGKASASKSQGGHPPEHAIDGNPETRWCGPDGNHGHSWQVDLGKPQEVTGANILWEQPALFQYTVEGSTDGKTWVMLSDQTKHKGREPLHQLKFSHKAIQHVRVKTTKVEGSWGSFWEFEVLGTKIVDRGVLAAAAKKKADKKKAPTTTGGGASVPAGLKATLFSPNTLTPCVASMGVAVTGEVYAGVDRIGSLGKGGGKGSIIRLVDDDKDGVHDSHTVYATIDNPRGIVPIGDKVYTLHGKWGEGKKFDAMHLSVLTDADSDGVADGEPKILVSNISTHKFNESRGVDHSTNGIRMGIDGWIYIAIGDFGFVDAKGTDGTTLTMYGGGVVRVRPDGTELETYCHGLRNIYDVAIDPFLNLYTRGNTNDGGGWNMRFIHEIQTGEYGYPILFKRYTSEIIPALVDIGGGSGTGAMFFDEPGWPEEYNDVPMMCDWGRGHLFIHRVTPDGPSFTQEQEEFIKCQRIADVDCDGSGQLFLGSWGKSGFSGGTDGWVTRVVPEDWEYKAFPDLRKLSVADLAKHLAGPSSKGRLHAQQEILRRGEGASEVRKIAQDKAASRKARVAAIFTLKQLLGPQRPPRLGR